MILLIVLIILVGLFYHIIENHILTPIKRTDHIQPLDIQKVNPRRAGGELYKRAGGEFARMSKKTNINPVISRRKTLETRSQSI